MQIALVHSADGTTMRLTLANAPVVVGREPGAGGLQIHDREISRKHAVFEPDGAGWRVTDLGSRNGIVVDGAPTASAALHHGSIVRIGGAVIVFVDPEPGGDPANAPLHQRKDHILALATAWLAEHHPGMTLSPAAAEALCLFHWPFDVRQLEQVLAASVVRAAEAGVIAVDHMPINVAEPLLSRLGVTLPPVDAAALVLDVDPTQANPPAADLERALRHFAGSVADVAVFFNRDRRQVHRWLKRHGIDPDLFRVTPSPR